jgi:hypothetical protein
VKNSFEEEKKFKSLLVKRYLEFVEGSQYLVGNTLRFFKVSISVRKCLPS